MRLDASEIFEIGLIILTTIWHFDSGKKVRNAKLFLRQKLSQEKDFQSK